MNAELDNLYCGSIEQGDVVLFKEKKEKKLMVVLQDDLLNGNLPTVVGAVLDLENEDEGFVNEVFLDEKDLWPDAKGICMLHQIATIKRKNILDKKSSITKKKLDKIYKALDVNLGKFRKFKL